MSYSLNVLKTFVRGIDELSQFCRKQRKANTLMTHIQNRKSMIVLFFNLSDNKHAMLDTTNDRCHDHVVSKNPLKQHQKKYHP